MKLILLSPVFPISIVLVLSTWLSTSRTEDRGVGRMDSAKEAGDCCGSLVSGQATECFQKNLTHPNKLAGDNNHQNLTRKGMMAHHYQWNQNPKEYENDNH